jgi:nitrate reductase gamma subunit
MLDAFLFSVMPYGVIVTTIVAVVFRLRKRRFGVSTLSSQFLESDDLFFGSVPWHFGILLVLSGHLLAFLFPRQILSFNSVPLRLYLLEGTGLALGLLALVGIVSLLWRRASSPRIRAVTSPMDLVLLTLLAVQVTTGVWTALFNRWGSSWFASSAAPYLWSVLSLRPDPATIAPLPWTVKTHIVGFYLMLAVLPFSRLMHALVPPLRYLWRPYELVIWNRRRPAGAPRRGVPPRRHNHGVVLNPTAPESPVPGDPPVAPVAAPPEHDPIGTPHEA